MQRIRAGQTADDRHRVVIVGGGFAGLHAAVGLKRRPASITLIDRRYFHVFQPLLYQVATSGLSPGDISSPLRSVLRKHRNVQVRLGEVIDFDVLNGKVLLEGSEVDYDTLVVAPGSENHYFGNDGWPETAPALKSMEDAEAMRRRILLAFENAEFADTGADRSALLTFVIVGAGPTGVELAGALAEIARDTLRADFRSIDTESARIILVEATDRVLATFPPVLSEKATTALEGAGVKVRTNTFVLDIDADSVRIRTGDREEQIQCKTVLWAAGVKASSLALKLADRTGAPTDSAGRLIVEPDLTVPGHPNIIALGDIASFDHQGSGPLPGLAAVASQQGKYVARLIGRRLDNRKYRNFRYSDKGTLATIGRANAVAHFGRVRISGYPAWLFWLFVHLMLLIGYENRVLVLVQWSWNYLTRNRSTRLIMGRYER